MLKVDTKNFAVVLHKPRFPENIGAAARAAKNMGIRNLVLVRPENCDLTKILRMATHAAEDVIAEMEVHDHLCDALGPYQFIVGTTARTGAQRRTVSDTRQMAEHLVSVSQNNRVALLFGPEDRGLTNSELRYCQEVVTIPTADFASLNLAQAVMIVTYEIFRAAIETPSRFVPRTANSFELEGMYEHVSKTLQEIHFLNPENPDYWMNNLRRFFNRMQLQAREVKIIRGICRQIDWYGRRQLRATPPTDCFDPQDGDFPDATFQKDGSSEKQPRNAFEKDAPSKEPTRYDG